MRKLTSTAERLLIPLLIWAIPLLVQANLQLTEIMPDPEGDDSAEWVELYNSSDLPVSTEGYTLLVKTRSTKLPSYTIQPSDYLILTKNEAGFTLTNTGANISLTDSNGKTITSFNYNKAPTGQSFALINTNWQWTNQPTPGSANILALLSQSKTTQTNIATQYDIVSLDKVTNLKSGDKITTEGIVVAEPGEISSSIAFLNGLQLNLIGGVTTTITRGQKLIISGSVSKTLAYGTRLTVRSTDDIKFLEILAEPLPTDLAIKEITHQHEGLLINTTGQIKQRGANWFTLENDSSQLRVNLRNSTYNWPKLSINENISITGLVTLNQGEVRLWPRQPGDISYNQAIINTDQTDTIDLSQKESSNWRDYALLIFIVIVITAGWVWQKRKLPSLWQILKDWLNKFR